MIEVKFLPLYNSIIRDYETSDHFDDAGRYMENLRRWLLEVHNARMISDDYGSNRTTPVLQFETEEQATLFTLRYR